MSKLSIIPFKGWHLEALDQSHGLAPEMVKTVEAADSVTVLDQDKILLVGGITEYWTGRGHVWVVFNPITKRNFVPLFRAIQTWLRDRIATKYRRIEMSVDYGMEIAHRRAGLLGFKLEIERAEQYLPDGRDVSIYSMVRG